MDLGKEVEKPDETRSWCYSQLKKKKNNQILAFLLFENNEIRMHQAIIWEVERDRVESTFSACF